MKFNVLTEAKKVLKGKPTKASEKSLLVALAALVLEHNGAKS
ncbi:MAG TPA: hypothetical protein VN950_05130 [Terriglobales bacterium]|nr:hypothetical protein [Terriglobales bacterium]